MTTERIATIATNLETKIFDHLACRVGDETAARIALACTATIVKGLAEAYPSPATTEFAASL